MIKTTIISFEEKNPLFRLCKSLLQRQLMEIAVKKIIAKIEGCSYERMCRNGLSGKNEAVTRECAGTG
jgi:hypothetical protein